MLVLCTSNAVLRLQLCKIAPEPARTAGDPGSFSLNTMNGAAAVGNGIRFSAYCLPASALDLRKLPKVASRHGWVSRWAVMHRTPANKWTILKFREDTPMSDPNPAAQEVAFTLIPQHSRTRKRRYQPLTQPRSQDQTTPQDIISCRSGKRRPIVAASYDANRGARMYHANSGKYHTGCGRPSRVRSQPGKRGWRFAWLKLCPSRRQNPL